MMVLAHSCSRAVLNAEIAATPPGDLRATRALPAAAGSAASEVAPTTATEAASVARRSAPDEPTVPDDCDAGVTVSDGSGFWLPPAGLVSRLAEVGVAADWRCWLCDEAVDPEMSVNDARGPSVDSLTAKTKGKRAAPSFGTERLAHRGCNTKKGAVVAVVTWPEHLFLVDPAPIIPCVKRLQQKGGWEIVARCPTRSDGEDAGRWLVDRLSRLCPEIAFSTDIRSGGDQFLLVLHR